MPSDKIIYTGVALLLFGVVFIGVAIFGLQETSYWQEHGVRTQGLLLDKYVKEECQTGSGGTRTCSNVYYFSYRYRTLEGKSFEGKDSVNQEFWEAQQKGAEFALLYSAIQASDSSVTYATDLERIRLLCKGLLGLGALLFLIGVVLIYRTRDKLSTQ